MDRIQEMLPRAEAYLSARDWGDVPVMAGRTFRVLPLARGEYNLIEGLEAIEIIKQDAIQLEYTYTAKTFSALVAYCQEMESAKEETLLFWNTQNSVDFSPIYNKVDYTTLPKSLHKFFDGTIPLDETPVHAHKIKEQ